MNIFVYTYMYLIAINEKRGMNLKESKDRERRLSGGRKEKGKMM